MICQLATCDDHQPRTGLGLPLSGVALGPDKPDTCPGWLIPVSLQWDNNLCRSISHTKKAAVAEWYRYRTVACFVTGSSPVPLKTRRVGQRCTLNLSRAETSSRWCGVVVRRGGASSGVVHVT
ncbi:uncharacterized protein TNCV_4443371 [Trichonephila clavipes]|nr:uncharacterized protein TNCV_4443371 [Trichonephila clavipes]